MVSYVRLNSANPRATPKPQFRRKLGQLCEFQVCREHEKHGEKQGEIGIIGEQEE